MLDGQVALVTGTSRGIGRAVASELARAGAAVAGCARGGSQGSFLDDLPAAERGRCQQAMCDVRARADVLRLRDEVAATLGAPDIVVNNAGIVARAAVTELREEVWHDILAANLTGTFLVIQAFVPAMKAKGRGRIINLGSIASHRGTPMLAAYCAAKHGVLGLTRALAEELRADGIAVNAICPGSVDTEMLRQGMPGAAPDMTAAEVAAAVLFLARDAPAALTGACIDVFG